MTWNALSVGFANREVGGTRTPPLSPGYEHDWR